MAEGVIFKALSGFYYVEHAEGTAECRARGRFRLEKNTPLVGDRVEFKPTESGKGVIISILPRKNSFVRPPIANIELMVIVASETIPVTDPYLIDRMTAAAYKCGCDSIICINKSDLDPATRLNDIYKAAGFPTIRTSAETGEGLSQLKDIIKGKTSAFTGNSGVGKSSIINVLDPGFEISTGEISRKLGRGRHTTRHVELYKLSFGAMIADTPGFSAYDTERLAPKAELAALFPDFAPYIGGCRFDDCAHVKEPGCSVIEAVVSGRIQKTRHSSYTRLYEQASAWKEWEGGNQKDRGT